MGSLCFAGSHSSKLASLSKMLKVNNALLGYGPVVSEGII